MSAVIAIGSNLDLKIISNVKGVIFGRFRRQSFKLTLHVLEDASNTMRSLVVSLSSPTIP